MGETISLPAQANLDNVTPVKEGRATYVRTCLGPSQGYTPTVVSGYLARVHLPIGIIVKTYALHVDSDRW